MPGPSVRDQTPSPPPEKSEFELQEDTPRKKVLKRKISELQKNNILKSQKIRRLQKMNWRQKKQISSLKAMTMELKKKNLLLEEHENIMLEHFGENKKIIQRLKKKIKTKG